MIIFVRFLKYLPGQSVKMPPGFLIGFGSLALTLHYKDTTYLLVCQVFRQLFLLISQLLTPVSS